MYICAFIGDMYRDFSSAIIKRLMSIAEERGHSLDIFGNCVVPDENPLHAEGLRSILTLPNLSNYDGIILCSDTLNHAGLSQSLMDRLKETEDLPPVVSIRSEEEGFYNIIPDNAGIMYQVTKHMIEACGSTDIGFIMGKDDLKDSYERLEGFVKAMNEHGAEVGEDRIFHGNYWINQGPETADFFIREDGSLPKGIVSSNDYMALGLCDELGRRGYSIPDDLMITGVDNLPMARMRTPSITTYEIPEELFALTAMNTLEKIASGEEVEKRIVVQGNLLLRESTGVTLEANATDSYLKLDAILREYHQKTYGFIIMSSDYESILTFNESIKLTLQSLKESSIFSKVCLCRYRENDRSLMGSLNGDEIEISDLRFPSDRLIPEKEDITTPRTLMFLPIHYKNEVYGYCAFRLKDAHEKFFDEMLEFTLMLFGQSLNRLRLYDRLYEVADVMDLYVKDALTGLNNRRGFENRISDILEHRDPEADKVAVVSIDMDDLKYINDNFGHSDGDVALKAVASSLTRSLSGEEFAARMGGDEFEAVLILDNPGRMGQFIRSVRKNLEEENERINKEYTVGVSIGICEVEGWSSLMDSINKADKAMYTEKRIKKNNAR
ncbi:MAG: GGDEF domain-containing protein [Saccharofermentans sp.]|nr:GGDEF domain-containing protein [Saccharofermentans sp.]